MADTTEYGPFTSVAQTSFRFLPALGWTRHDLCGRYDPVVALFRIERSSPHPVDETWRRLTQWQRHGAHVPLSSVALRTEGPTRVGSVVVAHTGVGRAGF